MSSGLASSPWETSVFIEAVGCGLFARAMSLLDSIDRSAPGDLSTTYDKLYRDICVLLALTAEARPREVEAVIDGQTISGDYLLIEAMNVCLIGPQLRLTDCDSDSDDRAGLDFVFLAAEHREQFLNYLIDSLAGRQTTAPVEVIRGQRMGMLWQGEPIHLDGRIWLDGKIRAGGTAGPPASQMIEMAIGESRLEILT